MSRRVVLQLLAVAGAVALGMLVVREPSAAVVLVLTIVAAVIGARRPFALGLGFLAWGLVRYTVLGAVGGFSWIVNFGEIAVVVFLVFMAAMQGDRNHWLLQARHGFVFAALFVTGAMVSWYLNGGPWLELLSGLRGHLLIPIAGVATVLLRRTEADRILAIRVAVVLAVAQVPFAVYQYVWGTQGLRGPDVVVGTLSAGGANVLGLWMLAMMTTAGVEYVRTRKAWLLLLIALWAWPFVASSARLGIVLAVPALLIVISTNTKGERSIAVTRRLIVAGIGVTLVMSLFGVYYDYRTGTAERDFSWTVFVRNQGVYRDYGVSRLGYVVYGWQFLTQESAFVPLGTGPASAASGAAANVGGIKYLDFWYGLQGFGHWDTLDPSRPREVPLPTQFGATLVEYGPVGLGLFMAFYATIGAVIMRRTRALDAPYADWRVFVLWYLLATVGTLYTTSWEGFSIVAIAIWWWPLVLPSASRAE